MTTSEQIRVLCVRSGVSLSELAMLSRLLPILEKYGFELRQQIVLN